MEPALTPPRRWLFAVAILAGSFLLFLVQPMVARMALPRLGGAPNVWNSAMLVYQALLLGGYGYAHWLGRFAIRRQATIHLALLLLAAATLPIGVAVLPPPSPGNEALWVPLLFLASIGPVFFVVSAQAPLLQRWYAAHPQAGVPWALYAASNLGSFGGLIAYPLLAEPLLGLNQQSLAWSLGYGLLVALVAAAALARRHDATPPAHERTGVQDQQRPGARRILGWLALSAAPSGLMLSTTTHLTTDLVAMPLLWVIPLGIYLLSFSLAFADRRGPANTVIVITPFLMLVAGGASMASRGHVGLTPVLMSVVLLFAVCVALHSRLYSLRPDTRHLTLFYLVMSAGGALGGLFTALAAPLVFDWAWEHPILVFSAAALLPVPAFFDWRRLPDLAPGMVRLTVAVLIAAAAFFAWQLLDAESLGEKGTGPRLFELGIALCGLALLPWRSAFLAVLALLMLAQGGIDTIATSLNHQRTRSYFGIYTLREFPVDHMRTLAHGTTLHGEQSTLPALRDAPISYYGPGSGAGIVFGNAPRLFGPTAWIGVVGLGTGTLACYHRPGQNWTFFEIDPAVLAYSTRADFTYLADCAPDAVVQIGDARLELAKMPAASFDLIAVDAFSSDSIPLHLLTREAFGTYLKALAPRGILLVHISNRYIELEPALAALARSHGLAARIRDDEPRTSTFTPSSWVILARDPARISEVAALAPQSPLRPLLPAAPRAWSDDHASILPYIRWNNLLGTNK